MRAAYAALDAPHHPGHKGEARVSGQPMEKLRPRVFPSLPSLLLENHAAHCKK